MLVTNICDKLQSNNVTEQPLNGIYNNDFLFMDDSERDILSIYFLNWRRSRREEEEEESFSCQYKQYTDLIFLAFLNFHETFYHICTPKLGLKIFLYHVDIFEHFKILKWLWAGAETKHKSLNIFLIINNSAQCLRGWVRWRRRIKRPACTISVAVGRVSLVR